MKFNTQVCTTKEQSERLLALGLKKETADMRLIPYSEFAVPMKYNDGFFFDDKDYTPAWSLHRLIDMMTDQIYDQKDLWKLNISCFPSKRIEYYRVDSETIGYYNCLKSFGGYEISLYESVIQCIEWLVKKGYFDKEYLEGHP